VKPYVHALAVLVIGISAIMVALVLVVGAMVPHRTGSAVKWHGEGDRPIRATKVELVPAPSMRPTVHIDPGMAEMRRLTLEIERQRGVVDTPDAGAQ